SSIAILASFTKKLSWLRLGQPSLIRFLRFEPLLISRLHGVSSGVAQNVNALNEFGASRYWNSSSKFENERAVRRKFLPPPSMRLSAINTPSAAPQLFGLPLLGIHPCRSLPLKSETKPSWREEALLSLDVPPILAPLFAVTVGLIPCSPM